MRGIQVCSRDGHYQCDAMITTRSKKLDILEFNNLNDEEIIRKIRERKNSYVVLPNSYSRFKKSLSCLDIPVIIEAGDVHHRIYDDKFRDFIKFHNATGIITDLKCSFPVFRDYLNDDGIKIFWNKWGVDLNILKDYKLEKIWDIFFSGKFSTYQFRKELHIMFSSMNSIKYKRYPPFPISGIPYEEYAKNINRSWIGIGGCTQDKEHSYYKEHFIGYTFPKNIEIPAGRACLLTSHFGDEEYLGFKDGENCILFDSVREARRKVEYYLNDKELLMKIIQKGYDLVHENHDMNITTNNLIDEIEKNI